MNENIIEEGQNEASGILQSHSRNLDIDPIRSKDSRKEKGHFIRLDKMQLHSFIQIGLNHCVIQ